MKKIYMVLIILVCTGCQTNPLLKPSRGITETVFPEYRIYINKDRKLTKIEKQARMLNLEAYELLIKRVEENE